MDEKNNLNKIQNIHTYSSDMADAVRKQEATVIKIALAEKERRDREKLLMDNKTNFSNNIFYIIGGIVLIGLSIFGTTYFIQKGKEASSVEVKNTTVNTIVKTDEQAFIDVTTITNKQDLLNAIKEEKIKDLKVGNTKSIILYKNTDNTRSIINVKDFFERLNISIPGILDRSIDDSFMLGVYNNQNEKYLFTILSINDYERAFSGMINWEPTILSSMFNLFSINVSSGSVGIFETPWQDKIVLNKDARVLKNENTGELMYYMFIDKNKLIITDSEEAIKEIIQRLVTQNIKPM